MHVQHSSQPCLHQEVCTAHCRETEFYARVMVKGIEAQEKDGKPGMPGLCFNNEDEQAMVQDVFENALAGLSEADRNLSAIQVAMAVTFCMGDGGQWREGD